MSVLQGTAFPKIILLSYDFIELIFLLGGNLYFA